MDNFYTIDVDDFDDLEGSAVQEKDWEFYRDSDSTEGVIKQAEANGADVLFPEGNELFLDLDTEEQWNELPGRLNRLSQLFRQHFEVTRVVPSNSGLPHRHVTVSGPYGESYDPAVRAGLQLYLGSDPVREVLCMRRCHWGLDNPTIFIEGGTWKKGA